MDDTPSYSRLAAELAEMPLFAGLAPHQVEDVAGTILERRVKQGKAVIKEGQWGHEFLLVLEGEMEVRRGDRVVATKGPGTYIGELAVLDDTRRNATVVATTDVVVGSIEASLFAPLLSDIPVLADRIAATSALYDTPSADD
jgi:CRP/FNR family transcriptional regulator, cyclic AMP receptor protein